MSSLANRKKLLLPTNRQRHSFMTVLRNAGLTTGLQVCLDAGDASSYPSGASWLDLSGNGQDFFLGADGSATATDPTFNGTSGRKTSEEYFSSDGGDYFTYDTTNPTWAENMHKANAKWSAALWFYPAGAGANQFFGTHQNGVSNVGVGFTCNVSNGNVTLSVANGSGAFILAASTSLGARASAWQMFGVSLDDAGANCLRWRNGVLAYSSGALASPSASSATRTLGLGQVGNGTGPIPSGGRIAMVAMWDGVFLTPGHYRKIFEATRGRFGV